jgi:hypothetical protein
MKGYVDELFSNFSLNSSSEESFEDSDMYENYAYPLTEKDFEDLKEELERAGRLKQ